MKIKIGNSAIIVREFNVKKCPKKDGYARLSLMQYKKISLRKESNICEINGEKCKFYLEALSFNKLDHYLINFEAIKQEETK